MPHIGVSIANESSIQFCRSSSLRGAAYNHHAPAPAEKLSQSPDAAAPPQSISKAASTPLPSADDSRSNTTATAHARSHPSHRERAYRASESHPSQAHKQSRPRPPHPLCPSPHPLPPPTLKTRV